MTKEEIHARVLELQRRCSYDTFVRNPEAAQIGKEIVKLQAQCDHMVEGKFALYDHKCIFCGKKIVKE